jgi:uncharacterized protein (TIGR03435 family)
MTPWSPNALANHLWQSTLFVGFVWLAARALRGNGARVRYGLWTAASVKFLVPVSLLVSLGERFEWRAAPASLQPAVSFMMEDLLAPALAAVAVPAATSQSLGVVRWLLLAVWIAGAAVVLLSWWRQWLPIRAALRRAMPAQLDPRCDAAGLVVMSSPAMLEPGVVGIRRPLLLLPDGIVDRLTTAQLRALIAHEQCHIRCHDNLAAAIHMVVEAVFWFHPLVWWIDVRLVDERERACDEAVLRSGNRPRDYAEGILEVCRRSVESRLACVAGVSGANLRRRLESIMRNEVGRPMTAGRQVALACAVVAAIAGPVAGGALKASPVSPPQDSATVRLPALGEAVAFEVASIRVNRSAGGPIRGGGTQGRTFTATNAPLRPIIAAAYGIAGPQSGRLLGGPSWIGGGTPPFIGSERFDIVATLPEGTTARHVPAMLRALLADRFKLVVHTEVREAPIYALVVARSDGRLGPQLRRATIDCEAAEAAGQVVPPPKQGERGICDSEIGGTIVGRGQRLISLARMLSPSAERPVVDRTGLTGAFDFDLEFPELNAGPGGHGGAGDAGGGVFTALREQLGLELESIRAPVEFVVIDRVERPTAD